MALETALLDRIEGRKSAPLSLPLLRLLGQLTRCGVALRHFGYDQAFFPIHRVDVPVISVGNILLGGSGKTPFVRFLSSQLAKTHKVAILTRGYRSQAEKGKTPLIVDPSMPASLCGDEPLLLAQALPNVEILVCADRVASAQLAQKRGAELIVLDDGMQHRRLHRDLEIVLVAADQPLGGKAFLPGGLLRDSPKRLQAADLIVVTGAKSAEDFAAVQQELLAYTHAPIAGMKLQVRNAADVRGKRVALFCGIARPRRFIDTLRALDCEIVYAETAADHGSIASLDFFTRTAKERGAELLVCTEKDYVKGLAGFTPLEIALEPAYNPSFIQSIIQEYL